MKITLITLADAISREPALAERMRAKANKAYDEADVPANTHATYAELIEEIDQEAANGKFRLFNWLPTDGAERVDLALLRNMLLQDGFEAKLDADRSSPSITITW